MGIQIGIGFLLDLLVGDPPGLPHPVRWIGSLIAFLEKRIRSLVHSPQGLKAAGVGLVFCTVGAAYTGTWLVLWLAGQISPYLAYGVGALIVYYSLATRCLGQEAMLIYQALAQDDLALARQRLSYIVGRDTQNLSEEEIVRGAVETVAENTMDGVVSPLFYTFLGGPALGMAYKAVNTLDSMVGYLNERYRYLGWAAARLDDWANWLPGRITGVLLLFAGALWGCNPWQGLRILWRDRRNHMSPNGGYPEAAMAGLLGIRIGGTNFYFGQPVVKPTIGDPLRSLEKNQIPLAVRIMTTCAFLALIIFAVIAALLEGVLA